MYSKIFVTVCVARWLLLVVGEVPEFRILAPPFVCPKEEDAVIDEPDNIVITLQTDAGAEVNFTWIVRWSPLVSPTQRFTVALWRTVRTLEKQLNGLQAEPGVYIINNNELLRGVNYIFNVTATCSDSSEEVEKSFNINNIDGDQQLLIEGHSNMFSVVLVGGQMTLADLVFMLEAQVTMCFKTHDYYFSWSVSSGEKNINVSYAKGSRLQIKANTLSPGRSYNVICKVIKYSSGEIITKNALPFQVKHRNFNISFNVDVMVVSTDTAFSLQTDILDIDYLQVHKQYTVTWECILNDEAFHDFQSDVHGSIAFPSGLPAVGGYLVSVSVAVLDDPEIYQSVARIMTVEPKLPIIEVHHIPRLVNKDSLVNLVANISNVVPGCSVSWFFSHDECLSPTNTTDMGICTENEHGIQISEPINFYSLEENFLSELTDFTNETSWKWVEAEVQAADGTARVVAECKCNTDVICTTEGIVYADVKLRINEKPGAAEVLLMPETGTAMETLFRISTTAVVNENKPLRYTFYCDLNKNDSLVLDVYLEHLATDSLLPYIEGGTSVWVEVCDSLHSCSIGSSTLVELTPGNARTLDALIEDAQAHVLRCEISLLRRLVASALVTYMNADQTEAFLKFTEAFQNFMRNISEDCAMEEYDQYTDMIHWLAKIGVDTSGFLFQ